MIQWRRKEIEWKKRIERKRRNTIYLPLHWLADGRYRDLRDCSHQVNIHLESMKTSNFLCEILPNAPNTSVKPV
jgi:hypothetical protein